MKREVSSGKKVWCFCSPIHCTTPLSPPVEKEWLPQWVWRPMFLVWLQGSEATTDIVFKILWLLKYILLKYCVLNFQELPEGQAQSWPCFSSPLPGAGAVILRVALVSVNTPAVLTSTTHAHLGWGQQTGWSDRPKREEEQRRTSAGSRSQNNVATYQPHLSTTYTSEKGSADCMPSPGYMRRKDRRRPGLASLADLWAPRSRRDGKAELQAVQLSMERVLQLRAMENNQCCGGCGEIGTLTCSGWECMMMKPLWKQVVVLKNVKCRITLWPGHPLLSMDPKETKLVLKQIPVQAYS